jgi:hypothetical protein
MPRATGPGPTSPRSRTKAREALGSTPTCIARKATRPTPPIGTAAPASLPLRSPSRTSGWKSQPLSLRPSRFAASRRLCRDQPFFPAAQQRLGEGFAGRTKRGGRDFGGAEAPPFRQSQERPVPGEKCGLVRRSAQHHHLPLLEPNSVACCRGTPKGVGSHGQGPVRGERIVRDGCGLTLGDS